MMRSQYDKALRFARHGTQGSGQTTLPRYESIHVEKSQTTLPRYESIRVPHKVVHRPHMLLLPRQLWLPPGPTRLALPTVAEDAPDTTAAPAASRASFGDHSRCGRPHHAAAACAAVAR
jgi:hypothetical protein